MANWMKQAQKNAAHALKPGERFVAAQQFSRFAVAAGGGAAAAGGGLIGAAAGHVIDKRREKREAKRQEEVQETTGVPEAAVAWPGSSALVAYTGTRLLFFGMKALAKPGDLFLEIPREDLARIDRLDVEGSLSAGRVKTLQARFVLRNGTAVSVHAPYRGVNAKRVDEFLNAVEGVA
jgi:hypothetical protein